MSKIVPFRPRETKLVSTTDRLPDGVPLLPPKRRGGWLRALLWFALTVLVIGAVLLLGMLISGHERFLLNARSGLNSIKPYAVLLQWVIIIGIALFWQQLIEGAVRRQRISEAAGRAALAARNRIVLAMIVIEVVLVMGIPFRWI
jgi:hypothetical protein